MFNIFKNIYSRLNLANAFWGDLRGAPVPNLQPTENKLKIFPAVT